MICSSNNTHPPYGVENLPAIFFTATELVADLTNAALLCNTPALPHKLDDMAEAIVRETPQTLHPELVGLTRGPYLRWASAKPSAYVDVFVKNSLGISQGPAHRRCGVW